MPAIRMSSLEISKKDPADAQYVSADWPQKKNISSELYFSETEI